jgi:predicted PurR-regulated permease PerM
MPAERAPSFMLTLSTFVIVGAALYFGRDLLVPVALATLLSFLLSPVVTRVERMGASPQIAVALVTFVLAVASALGMWMVTRELGELLADLPDLRVNLREKIRAVVLPLRSLADALGWVEKLSEEVGVEPTRGAQPVQVIAPSNALELIGRLLPPLLGPIGLAGVVVVLTLFMLIERRDLRDRLIRLLGIRDVPFSIGALDEAGPRVSAYLGRLALVCSVHGFAVSVGLALLGLPGAVLFGVLSALLRVIPYVGPWIAAGLPTALALAAYPGWSMAAYTAGFFVVLELISNNVLEPWLFGAGAGLSPFGVILAAFFWTWVWGAPGLVLAIPLTVCLVVLGRYVPQLSFITTLIGDEPLPPPQARFYERLVAGDADQAGAILRQGANDNDVLALSDRLVLPALVRLAHDRESGARSPARIAIILDLLNELLDELLASLPRQTGAPGAMPVHVAPVRDSAVERFAVDWLARVLAHASLAIVATVHEASRREELRACEGTVLLSALSPGAARRALQLGLQWIGDAKHPRVVLGLWGPSRARVVAASEEIVRVHTCADLHAVLLSAPDARDGMKAAVHA